ncbi:hypothetical protein CRYUN_Cryun26dG0018700 [Craigia yunnanensis]
MKSNNLSTIASYYKRENYRQTNDKRVKTRAQSLFSLLFLLLFLFLSVKARPLSPFHGILVSGSNRCRRRRRDFGTENAELSKCCCSQLNHDSWSTQQFSGKRKDRVQLQLEWIVGYKHLDFTKAQHCRWTAIFMWGSANILEKASVHESLALVFFIYIAIYQIGASFRYGVQDMDRSAKRIYEAAVGTPEDRLVILLAHNGPTGVWACQFNLSLDKLVFPIKVLGITFCSSWQGIE